MPLPDPSSVVGGLELPAALIRAVTEGRWSAPPPSSPLYQAVFGEDAEQPTFYDLAAIRRQNATYQTSSVNTVFGEPVPGVSIGIDPTRSVLIGDLGLDMPIALDYRHSPERPSVAYLGYRGRPCWIEVAADLDQLLVALDLA